MSTFVKIIRWLLALFFIFLLPIVILFGIFGSAFSFKLTNPQQLKDNFKTSRVYDTFGIDLLNALTVLNSSNSTQPDALQKIKQYITKDTQFNEQITQLFPAASLENKVNTIIDESYSFLAAKKTKPSFNIKLVDDPTAFEKIVNEKILQQDSVGVNAEISENNWASIINDLNINSEKIPLSTENAKLIQKIYSIIKIIPILSIFLFLINSCVIILLIPGWKKRFLTTGITAITTSLSILLSALTARYSFDYIFENVLVYLFSDIFKTQVSIIFSFSKLIRMVYFDILNSTIFLSIIVSVVSLGYILIGVLVKRRHY